MAKKNKFAICLRKETFRQLQDLEFRLKLVKMEQKQSYYYSSEYYDSDNKLSLYFSIISLKKQGETVSYKEYNYIICSINL